VAVCAHLHIFNERVRLLIFEAKPLGSINLETNEAFKHDGSPPQLILDPIFGSKPGEAASSKELDPRREPLMLLTAGDCHTVCLCAESKHLATPSVLHRVGVLLLSQVPSPPGLVSCTRLQCFMHLSSVSASFIHDIPPHLPSGGVAVQRISCSSRQKYGKLIPPCITPIGSFFDHPNEAGHASRLLQAAAAR